MLLLLALLVVAASALPTIGGAKGLENYESCEQCTAAGLVRCRPDFTMPQADSRPC